MSETGSVQPAASAVPPPCCKRRWLIALLLVAVFLCGIICGAGVTVFGIMHGVRDAARHPELQPDRQTKWLTARLKLDAGQREQVRTILTEQSHELRPLIVARLEKTEAEIEKILTPGQQAKLRAMVRRWLPDLPEPPPPKPPAP
jgi:uncharacterized membrane protein